MQIPNNSGDLKHNPGEFHYTREHGGANSLINCFLWREEYPESARFDRPIFRGENSGSYKLIPTAFRGEILLEANKDEKFWKSQLESSRGVIQNRRELEIIREFYETADRSGLVLPNCQKLKLIAHHSADTVDWRCLPAVKWFEDNEFLEVAGLAQHYGLPTRLLDWTFNPLVACFFASLEESQDGWMSIWELKPFKSAKIDLKELNIVIPPYGGNPNLAAQRGLFTLMCDNGHPRKFEPPPLDEALWNSQKTERKSDYLIRHKLPGSSRNDLQAALRRLGVTHATIFPGFKGAAEEVKANLHYLLQS